MRNAVSDQHEILNFTNSDNVQYAVIGPANLDPSEDFKATSFAVSTTCLAILQDGCNLSQPLPNTRDGLGSRIMLVPFICTKNKSGIDITGNLTGNFFTQTHSLNFHKYASESPPFFLSTLETPEGFRNPWSVLVFKLKEIVFKRQGDGEGLPPSFRNDTRIWKHDVFGAFTLMLCNVTAGAASMPGTRFLGTVSSDFEEFSSGPESRSSPSAMIRAFELDMSKAYSLPLASQLSPRASLLAQVRTSKVVTRLPVAALWTLVIANLGFALLGVGLAGWALTKAGPGVHQVQCLTSALFDREKFEQSARAVDGLFTEKTAKDQVDVKRIGFKRTSTGGSAFTVYDVGYRAAQETAMRKQYLGNILG
ncbi:hypothetical protein BU23DRAFT_634502 [Bimuria novae-zelandiae CBS 107.79]|uniref:Uncharacterized protein n=1 Tax=Bimuria novae-zelandiae CBS 107.79 TaxID=1447943 RepID=A0A6A5VEU3_9PLEO|nr:hypothetical protein BU23DRAFT_634502 [Bimuria novae-zelandiae CBS 107.79]